MTNEERKKIIIRSWVKIILDALFVISIIYFCYHDFKKSGILFLALMIINILYYGFPFTALWGFIGIGLILFGYEIRILAMIFLVLSGLIFAVDIILWMRAIKKYGKKGLLRLKPSDNYSIYARKEFYEENEITCILWRKFNNPIRDDSRINDEKNILKSTNAVMSNYERKRAIKLYLSALLLIMLLTSIMICIFYEKIIWVGILFIVMGIVNIYFLGLPFTIVLILGGITFISIGYEQKEIAIIFGAFTLMILISNVILMHKSIASGELERLGILAKSNRFAFIDDYLKKNDIICILFNKLKQKMNWSGKG